MTLLADGGCEVSDDGRGIPVDVHEEQGQSAAEVVLTVLHAGGKFGGDGYKVSGGLHGVGVSVVNALSRSVEVEIDRDGKRHFMSFADGGEPKEPLSAIGDAPDGRSGTTVRFWPDPTIFKEGIEFRAQTLTERFQMMAFLNRGLAIHFTDLRPGHDPTPEVFHYEGGIIDFVRHLNAAKESLFSDVGYFEGADEEQEVEIAFQWNTGFNDGIHSFANGINTTEGGMHVEGFRGALTRVINAYAHDRGVLKDNDDNLSGEDIREGLTAIVSVRLRDPQFEGQTKAKLGNVSMRSLVAEDHQRATWPTGSKSTRPRPNGSSTRRCMRSGPVSRHATPARTSGASRRSTGPVSPGSWPTAPRRSRASRSCTSSRATRPAVRPRRPATRGPWPSSRSGARSSTSSGRASTRC